MSPQTFFSKSLNLLKAAAIHTLTLLFGIGLMTSALAQRDSSAARLENVAGFSVNQLGNLRGQTMTVMYVVGTKPFIATESSQVTVYEVKKTTTLTITSDTMAVPAVQIEREGIRQYNLVVIAVSPQANFSWLNADGSAPTGMAQTGNHLTSLVKVLDRAQLTNAGANLSIVLK